MHGMVSIIFCVLSTQQYLMQFGYLALSDMETQQLRSTEEIRDAVRQLQRNAGLPQTGILDHRTRVQMARPRCGVPDVQAAALRRSSGPESFTLNSGQWPHTDITYRYLLHCIILRLIIMVYSYVNKEPN